MSKHLSIEDHQNISDALCQIRIQTERILGIVRGHPPAELIDRTNKLSRDVHLLQLRFADELCDRHPGSAQLAAQHYARATNP